MVTTHRTHLATRLAVAALSVAAGAVITPIGTVSACSCDAAEVPIVDQIGEADLVFVGRLDASEVLDPPEGSEPFDRRYELVVEHAVKGVEVGDRVVMFGSSIPTSCGDQLLDEDLAQHVVLTRDFGDHLRADSTPACSLLPSVDELLAVDLTLPATGPGPRSLIAVGRLGEAELIGYGDDGHPVSYGDIRGRSGAPVLCPSEERFVHFEQEWSSTIPVLTVRDTTTLSVLEQHPVTAPEHAREALGWHLTDGAELTCRSPEGDDVVATLSWERSSDGQSYVVAFRGEQLTVSAHDLASKAGYDTRTGDVVAVSAGALVRLGLDGSSPVEVARLSTGTSSATSDALFVAPNGAEGWWVGLGDGEYEVATRLTELVHVDEDGSVERWAVEPWPDAYTDSATVVDDWLLTDGSRVRLPRLGSSTGDDVLTVEPVTPLVGIRLADGRSIRPPEIPGRDPVLLISENGSATPLRHLLRARHVLSVRNERAVDPASVERAFTNERLDSPWILPSPVSDADPTTTTRPAATSEPAPTSQPASTSAPAEGDGPTAWLWWTVVPLLALVVLLTAAVARIRRRAAT
jgi:hypothetical protein